MLFECKLAMDVWKMLGLDLVIKQALKVDKAGELVLAHLLCLPEQQIQVLGLRSSEKRWQRRLGICGMKGEN